LHHLWLLVEEKDGGLPWIQMMDRSTPTMSYKAWQRQPKVCYFLRKIFWSYLNYLLGCCWYLFCWLFRMVLHSIEAALFLKMLPLRWWGTCFGMMSSDQDGTTCLQAPQLLKSVPLLVPWKCSGYGRCINFFSLFKCI